MSGMVVAVVAGCIMVLGVTWLLLTYNRLVKARNGVQSALAQIDVQLQRRHDLIPRLVETAKGYMAHEREALEAVVTARAAAVGAQTEATGDAPGSRGDAHTAAGVGGVEGTGPIARMAGAENLLTQALGQLYMRVEAYPDLKASETMMQLSEDLTSTENRVAYARQAYNDAVLSYNTKRDVFPTNLVARSLAFVAAEPWEAAFSGVRAAPGIVF